MRKTEVKRISTGQLIDNARALSSDRMRAICACKPKDGNRMFDLLVAIHWELRARGVEAQQQLLGLLNDPDPGTRCWVATAIMEFAPDKGERVLADLARNAGGLVGFSAEWALKEWKAGTLKPL